MYGHFQRHNMNILKCVKDMSKGTEDNKEGVHIIKKGGKMATLKTTY